jgi:hypothetical protein
MKLGQLSAVAADAIDKIYLEKDKTSLLGSALDFLRIRALLVSFFILNIVDMGTSLVMAGTYAFRSLFVSETTQDSRLKTQGHFATLFGRSFYAFLATPISLFLPKLVIFYFTSDDKPSKGITSGGDFYHEDNVDIAQPEQAEELAQSIQKAIQDGRSIIPKGAGRSQGKQFIPNNNGKNPLIVDLQKMNAVEVHSNPGGEPYAWVEAGTLWSKLQVEASKLGFAVKVMQASNVFSVGGSIGANIHGWDYHAGMLSNCIEEMEIINTQGNIQRITPEDELFHHITGGYGLFGIVTRVKMKLAINENLQRESVNVSPKDYLTYFNDHLRDKEKVKLHLYRLSLNPDDPLSEGFTETYVKTDGKPVKDAALKIEDQKGTRLQRIMINVARQFDWARRIWWNMERQDYLDNHPIAPRNEIMQAPINAMFNTSVSEAEWLQEYFLPGDQLESFIKDFGQILKKNDVTLLNATVRFVKQNDKSPLSYAHDGERFAVVICFNQPLKPEAIRQAKKWLRDAQALAVNKGGAYYLPYQHVSSPEVFKKSYPGAQKAQEYKEQIDEKQNFTSGMHQAFIVPQKEEHNYVLEVLSTPEIRDEFKGFLKNVLQRVDSDKLYTLLDDILSYEDSHEGIYRELCVRLPEIMPSALGDIRNTLNSLAAIKKDLGEQARSLLPADLKTIDGIMEFGSPGRYSQGFKQHYKVTGKITAIDDALAPSPMHTIDAGTLSPYDKYLHLDYNNLDLTSILDHSVEVVTCYVGLHHFSEEKLNAFLKQVKRIMKPDSHFLLVDHDVVDEKSLAMAHMAHFIFNAVNGVTVQEELNEIRNFQPMSYWQEKLAQFDIKCPELSGAPKIRAGDPTRNSMIIGKETLPVLQAITEMHGRIKATTTASVKNSTYDVKSTLSAGSEASVVGLSLFKEPSNEQALEKQQEHSKKI